MQMTNIRTIVGVFADISDAKRATDELRSLGFSAVRLVENDQDVKFTGTAERQSATESYQNAEVERKQTGISAFFARLFGFDDKRPSWKLDSDSEAYFQDAYDKKHHLVIVDECSDPTVCREVMTRMGGVVEDQGSQLYERELQRDQTLAGTRADTTVDSNMNATQGNTWDTTRDITLSSNLDKVHDTSLSNLDNKRDTTLSSHRDNTLPSERVMELREEQLDVRTDRVQAGEVQVRKEIVTENKTIEVPVTREEIVVERRPLEGAAVNGTLETAGLDTDTKQIRIPVSEEHVHIDKKVAPREEIRVSKEKITDNKKVSEDVRREEAHVESDGRVAIRDRSSSTRPPLSSTRGSDSTQPGV